MSHRKRTDEPLMLNEEASVNSISSMAKTLFPWIDTLILYLPTYVTYNRPKLINFIILSLLALYILENIIASIYNGYAVGTTTDSKTASIVVIIIFDIMPSMMNYYRIRFFYKHFPFKLWKIIKNENNDSYLLNNITTLQQTQFASKFRKKFFGALILTSTVYFLGIYFILYEYFSQDFLQHYPWIEYHGFIVMFCGCFMLCSNLLLTAVVNLHLTESSFHSKAFETKLNDHIANNRILEWNLIFDDYHVLYHKIKRYNELCSTWISFNFNLSTLQVWYSVNMFQWYGRHDFDFVFTRNYQLKWCIMITATSIYNTILFCWMIRPTFDIATQSENAREAVSNYVHNIIQQNILKNKLQSIYKADQELIEINVQNVLNEEEISNKKGSYSDLLNVLNRLLFLMDNDRCYYNLLGIEINKENALKAVIGLIATRILTFLFVFK